MPVTTDLDMNRLVRRILVKHWIDLGRLSVRTVRGHVTLHGLLRHIEGTATPLTGRAIDAMFYEIRRLPNVGRVDGHFENWTDAGGLWHSREEAERDTMQQAPEARVAIEDTGGDD